MERIAGPAEVCSIDVHLSVLRTVGCFLFYLSSGADYLLYMFCLRSNIPLQEREKHGQPMMRGGLATLGTIVAFLGVIFWPMEGLHIRLVVASVESSAMASTTVLTTTPMGYTTGGLVEENALPFPRSTESPLRLIASSCVVQYASTTCHQVSGPGTSMTSSAHLDRCRCGML
jgi:hypothetical protein